MPGPKFFFRDQKIIVEETNPEKFNENDEVVFLTATSDVSQQIAPIAKKHGSFVIDDSSAYRMDPQVPLVILKEKFLQSVIQLLCIKKIPFNI